MDDPTKDIRPNESDMDAALKLARKHLYGGKEPYGPAVYSIAAMLCEYRIEFSRELAMLNEAKDRLLRDTGRPASAIALEMRLEVLEARFERVRELVRRDPYYKLAHDLRAELSL